MKNMKKKIPNFKNEDHERNFWGKHDSADYIDYNKADKSIFINLRPTTHSISIRMPDYLLNRLKILAHKKDIPYQSLLKIYLTQKIEEEIKSTKE